MFWVFREFPDLHQKDILFIPGCATQREVATVLDLSFEFLRAHEGELVRKYWWKAFWLLLAKSLEREITAPEVVFRVPEFLCIPTSFYTADENKNDSQKNTPQESVQFTTKQEVYLAKVFENFAGVPYIAIRSSADREDAWERNYAGVFHTWFCSTTDFDAFKREVKEVLWSAKEVEWVTMWIVIMEVPWTERQGGRSWIKAFCPDGWGVMATTHFWDRVTISAEFWMPVGITSWKNHESRTIDFDENGGVLQICLQEYTSCEDRMGGFVLSKWGINHGMMSQLKNIDNERIGIFDKEIYQRLVAVWKRLEKRFGYPLDIEFAVNNGEIFILQVRKFPDDHIRPENMTPPSWEWIRNLLDHKDRLSSFWFLDNESLHFHTILFDECHGMASDFHEARQIKRDMIVNKLRSLEQIRPWTPYALVVDYTEVFPNIHMKEFPWLRLVVMKGNKKKYKLSHAYMMLRELSIPTIMCSVDSFWELDERDGEWLKVYLDGNTRCDIYTDTPPTENIPDDGETI